MEYFSPIVHFPSLHDVVDENLMLVVVVWVLLQVKSDIFLHFEGGKVDLFDFEFLDQFFLLFLFDDIHVVASFHWYIADIGKVESCFSIKCIR